MTKRAGQGGTGARYKMILLERGNRAKDTSKSENDGRKYGDIQMGRP
jgi:hypothetical protein